MASRGFIELLRLADLAKARQSDRHGDQNIGWRGVVFELGGQRMVAPLGEVSEVLSMPEYTMMPLVQPWLLGIANVRGRLLPLTDLAKFLQMSRQTSQPNQGKVIVIDHQSLFLGLIVDQVLGIEQFSSSQYRAEPIDVDSPFAPYNHGQFVKNGQSWFVFLPSLLVEDPHYIDAAM